jgi:hypothetical protein
MAEVNFVAGIEYVRAHPGEPIRTTAVPGFEIFLKSDDSETFTLLMVESPRPVSGPPSMTWSNLPASVMVKIIATTVQYVERKTGQPIDLDEFDRIALANPDLFV